MIINLISCLLSVKNVTTYLNTFSITNEERMQYLSLALERDNAQAVYFFLNSNNFDILEFCGGNEFSRLWNTALIPKKLRKNGEKFITNISRLTFIF